MDHSRRSGDSFSDWAYGPVAGPVAGPASVSERMGVGGWLMSSLFAVILQVLYRQTVHIS